MSDLNAVYVLHFIAEPGGVVHLALEVDSRDLKVNLSHRFNTSVSWFRSPRRPLKRRRRGQ